MLDPVMLSIAEVDARAKMLIGGLTDDERAVLAGLKVPKRRRDWLAGRIAAKRAVQRLWGLPFTRIGIYAIQSGTESGRPCIFVDGEPTAAHLSISHSGDVAAAVVAREPVGFDVEVICGRPQIESIAFSESERTRWASARGAERNALVTEAWCTKEAVAKWRGDGLRARFADLIVPASRDVQVRSGRIEHQGLPMAWVCVCGPQTIEPSAQEALAA